MRILSAHSFGLRGAGLSSKRDREATHAFVGVSGRQCTRLAQLWFHEGSVKDIEFSPDGQWVLDFELTITRRACGMPSRESSL